MIKQNWHAIVSVDSHWGIGQDGHLAVTNADDMRRFAHLTTGHTVVMGRRTLDSLPRHQPLPRRRNIVLTRQANFACPGALAVHSLAELFAATGDDKVVWVIGGAQVYQLLLPYCQSVEVTYNNYQTNADCFFPDLSQDSHWRLVNRQDHQTDAGLEYSYLTYQQTKEI